MSATHWRILIVLMIAEMVAGFETSMVLSTLAAWQRILGDPVLVGWLVSSYLLVQAVAAALLGRLGDILGRKRVLLVTIALAGIGSLISATGQSYGVILAGRAMQGIAGGALPLCFSLAHELLPREKSALGVGFIIAAAATSSAFGLLIGGHLTDHHGPASIFAFSAAFAFVAAPIVYFGLPASSSRSLPPRFDWLGGLLFGLGLAALLYGLSSLRAWGESPGIALATMGGLAMLAWWFAHERRHPDPLIDVRLLSTRNVVIANLAMLALAIGAMQITQITSLLIQQPAESGTGLGRSATFLGAIKLPTVAVGVLGSISVGWLLPRFGHRMPVVTGALLIATSTAAVAFMQDSLVLIVAVLCMTNVGINLAYATLPTVVLASAPAERAGEAAGVLSVFRAAGQAFGAQFVAVLMSLSMVESGGHRYTSAGGYTVAFLFLALTASGVAALTLALRPIGRKAPAHIPA